MTKISSLATEKRHSKRLVTSLAVVVLAVMSLLGYLIWSGYREAKYEAEIKTRNYAAIIEGRLEATLRRADADLQELARTIPVAALSKQAVSRYARELDAKMEFHLINFPELAALRIFDANGDQLYTTGSDTTPRTHISDRSYFRWLRDNPQAGLVFSEVVISRSRDRPSVVAAKALRDEQGAFRGIVLAALDLGYFQKLFQSLELGAHGVVSIYRSDDFTPVVRWPMVEGKIDTPLPPGNPARAALARDIKTATIEFSSSTDGIVRIYSFRVLDHYPFFVSAALGSEDVLAGWRARALVVGLSSLLLLGLLTGLLYWLWRAEAALKANEELMRTTFEQVAVGIAHIAPGTYRILMANDKFCDLLGYTQHELTGTDSRLLTPPDDMPAREDERAQVMAGKIKTSSSERRLIRKDGALLWVNRSLSLVRDLAGQPQYFISVIEDIAERKHAEQLLTLEHTVARSLANSTSASAALIDVIRSICETQGWECGRYLRMDEQAGVLRFSESWNMPGDAIGRFVASKRDAVIGPGVGLAGRARQSGQPAWTADIKNAAGSLGAAVTLETGMHCAFHFPVISEGKTVGVFAFNSRKVREPDDRLLQAVNVIGSQIGQFLQRKQAEAVRAQLAAIVENSGDAIMSRSSDHKILTWNAAAERLFGYAAAEVIGQPTSLLVPPEDKVQAEQHWASFDDDKPVLAYDAIRLAKDGRRIDVSVIQSPIKDSNGELTGTSIAYRDISERKRSEAAQSMLATIVKNSNDAIMSRSLDHKVMSWNAAAERLFGYSAAETIGQDIYALIMPPDREAEAEHTRAQLTQHRAVLDLETVRRTKDGSLIDVSLSQSPIINEDGVMTGVALIFRDIRERKKAQAALRDSETRYGSVIAAIAEGVVLRDKDAKILTCNASAERILGRTLDQMRGSMFYDSSWQAIREDGSLFLREERPIHVALRTGKLQSNVVQGLRKPDGSVLWLSMNVQPLFDESGTILTGVVSTLTDVTESKQAEKRQAMEHAVTRVLAEAGTSADGIPRIIRIICESLGWACGAHWQWDEKAQVLRCAETWHIDAADVADFIATASMTINEAPAWHGEAPKTKTGGVVRRVWMNGAPVWFPDVAREPEFRHGPIAAKAGLHCAFGFPVMTGAQPLGVMEFYSRNIAKPDEALLQVVQAIGSQIGQFLQRKQAEERIQYLAAYDSLTSLPNRNMFRDRLTLVIARAKRSGRMAALMFLDLDRFKEINDTLGHATGDKVLQATAGLLRASLRDVDTISRLGGDEFTVVLENIIDVRQVKTIVEKIKEAFTSPIITQEGQDIFVTASIGIALYPLDADNIDALLQAADVAMYRAKQKGRNTYEFYGGANAHVRAGANVKTLAS